VDFITCYVIGWHSSAICWALDLQSRARRFNSQSGTAEQTVHTLEPRTSPVNGQWHSAAGKVTTGHALQNSVL